MRDGLVFFATGVGVFVWSMYIHYDAGTTFNTLPLNGLLGGGLIAFESISLTAGIWAKMFGAASAAKVGQTIESADFFVCAGTCVRSVGLGGSFWAGFALTLPCD